MRVPKLLRIPGLRFILLKKDSKIPIEKNWQTTANYTWNHSKILKHQGNIGIVCGYGNLRVFDCDDKPFGLEIEKLLPKTFTILTGSGKRHYYIFSDYSENHVLAGKKGEFRAQNMQVVIPGSVHPSGNLYDVLYDHKIVEVKPDRIKEILSKYTKTKGEEEKTENTKPSDKSRSGREFAEVCRLLKQGCSKDEIFKKMQAFAKWATAPQHYREHTFNKAEEKVKKTAVVIKASDDEKKEKKENQSDRIFKTGLQNAKLFHDQYKIPHATINIGDHKEVQSIQGVYFRRWLCKRYFELSHKLPNSNSIKSAIELLQAYACFEGSMINLYNRIAWHEGSIYYDLTDKNWRAIKIDEHGWETVEEPPTLFKRYSHQKPQCEPHNKGNYDLIEKYYNIKNPDNKQLIKVYNISCLIPDIPHPIPILHGPQGCAKSSAFKISRELIDPSVMDILGAPKEKKELVQMLAHNYCAYFDNITTIQEWLSDMFCKAVTGDGFSKRQLYTDDEDIIYTFKRCLGINGINVAVTKPDLLDRAILLGFNDINKSDRLTEKKLWSSFEKDKPKILAGMFDILSQAMRIKKQMEIPELPRMADFCEWAEAISRALGYPENSFIQNYFENINLQNDEALESHVVGPCVMELIKSQDFEGTPSALLDELLQIAEKLKINTKSKGWPKAPHVLTRRLKEIETNLKNKGITLVIAKSGDRIIRLYDNNRKASKESEASVIVEDFIDEKDGTDSMDANPVILDKLRGFIGKRQQWEIQNLYEEVHQEFPEINESRFDSYINHFKRQGEVFEPRSGFISIMR